MTTNTVEANRPTRETFIPLAADLDALADPSRLQILHLLAVRGRSHVGAITAELGTLKQPTVSHHLAALERAGMISREKNGVWVFYAVRKASVATLMKVVRGVAAGDIPASS